MEAQLINIGDVVRHRHILQGTDLYVFAMQADILQVRYAHNGLFQTQELFVNEVSPLIIDADEYE